MLGENLGEQSIDHLVKDMFVMLRNLSNIKDHDPEGYQRVRDYVEPNYERYCRELESRLCLTLPVYFRKELKRIDER